LTRLDLIDSRFKGIDREPAGGVGDGFACAEKTSGGGARDQRVEIDLDIGHALLGSPQEKAAFKRSGGVGRRGTGIDGGGWGRGGTNGRTGRGGDAGRESRCGNGSESDGGRSGLAG